MKPDLPLLRRLANPLLLGAANALAYSPGPLPSWSLPWLQLLCLAGLVHLVVRLPTTGQAARAGLLFGLGKFAVGLYWIYISLHTYGDMAALPAAGAVLALAAGESLFIALAAACAHHLAAPRSLRPASPLLAAAIWAANWTLSEWLRGTLLTGFPWLNSGYAHVDGMLAGWAPLLGVYGIAGIAAYASAAAALLVLASGAAGKTSSPSAQPGAVLAAALLLAGVVLQQVQWSRPSGEPIIVRLTQGNIPQSEKFDPALIVQGLETYMRLAALPPRQPDARPGIIVLPETIMVLFQDQYTPEVWQRWRDIAAQTQATLIMGAPLRTQVDGQDHYTNSTIALTADTPVQNLLDGAPALRYDKHHLVPFGEFVPTGFHWFVDAVAIPLGDFNRGAPRQQPFELQGQAIAPNICYEDLFGEEIIRAVRPGDGPGASILLNLSNLAWFGDSWALRQHLQISRMRALETARPMLRATNTGMTAVVDPDGMVRAQLPPNTLGVLDVQVQGMQGLTPYVRWGNAPVLAVCALILLCALVRLRRSARLARSPH